MRSRWVRVRGTRAKLHQHLALSPMPVDDDDDWVGEPPEGRHTRDQANPEFWRRQRPPEIIAVAVFIAIVVLVVVLLLR